VDQVFTPLMDDAQRMQKIKGWERAINATNLW
jgi:glycerol kinase